MANRKKPYFAQNNVLALTGHRSRYFDDHEDARQWLRENGGGTIKERDADVVQDPLQVRFGFGA